jgi:hypothetical protein
LVWSDGTHVDRQIINLTDTTPFGTKTFKIPFDATGKKWVRFAYRTQRAMEPGSSQSH